jgi:fructosamine-3-kinase
MSLAEHISLHIATVTGGDFVYSGQQNMGGGCINSAFRLDGKETSYFVKTNSAHLQYMFEAEAAGLQAIADTGTIRVPRPVCFGTADNHSYLVMEYLTLGGGRSAAALGEQLAAMHRHTAKQFGFHVDNTIGSTPQNNSPDDDWTRFWRQRRLGDQLEMARRNGCGHRLIEGVERLIDLVPLFFADYHPAPSILHGDLWSGNYSCTADGQPVIFDPATYYGDREADIAMTELFGGFDGDFYSAYNQSWPLDDGYRVRKTLYNLYHVINHFNLFGGGYLEQAESMTQRLLSEAG